MLTVEATGPKDHQGVASVGPLPVEEGGEPSVVGVRLEFVRRRVAFINKGLNFRARDGLVSLEAPGAAETKLDGEARRRGTRIGGRFADVVMGERRRVT